MTYSIHLTGTAKADLLDIAEYIAVSAKEIEPAKRFVNNLRKKCSELSEFPYSGSLPKDSLLRNAGYRFISYKKYLVFYSVNEKTKTVIILAVFSSRRDYTRLMYRFLLDSQK